MTTPLFFVGRPIVINDLMGWETVREIKRFPRSKKKRIIKKWLKSRKNYKWTKIQVPEMYTMNQYIIINTPGLAQLKQKTNPSFLTS